MSVKRAYGFPGASGTQHGELGRLLSRRARNDSPVTSFKLQNTPKNSKTELDAASLSQRALQVPEESAILAKQSSASPFRFPNGTAWASGPSNSCFPPLLLSSHPTTCSCKAKPQDQKMALHAHHTVMISLFSPHFWFISSGITTKKVFDTLRAISSYWKKKKIIAEVYLVAVFIA